MTTSCGVSPDSPCFVAPAPGFDPLWIGLGLLLLLLGIVAAAQMRRP